MTAPSPSAILSLSTPRPCPILFPLTLPVSDFYAAEKEGRRGKKKKKEKKPEIRELNHFSSHIYLSKDVTLLGTITIEKFLMVPPTMEFVNSLKCNLSGNQLLRS